MTCLRVIIQNQQRGSPLLVDYCAQVCKIYCVAVHVYCTRTCRYLVLAIPLKHDHLINRMGRIPGQGETWLSDGSYEGYKWDGSMWVYDEKVFEQITEEGNYPRPVPVLDMRKEGRGK